MSLTSSYPKIGVVGLLASTACILLAAPESQLQISFSNTSDQQTQEAFIYEDVAQSRIVTTTQELTMEVSCKETELPFVLLQMNETNYPIFPQNGEFSQQVSLNHGSNKLKLSYQTPFDTGSKSKEIVLLKAAIISGVFVQREGEQPILLQNETSLGSEIPTISVPKILIRGENPTSNFTSIQVRDQFGSPIMVNATDNTFEIPYILRNGTNVLTIRSTYDEQVISTDKIELNLKDVVEFAISPSESQKAFFEIPSSPAQAIKTHLEQIPVSGSIPCLPNGYITLNYGNKTKQVEVIDHQFSTELTIQPASQTNIRAELTIGDQVFIKSISLSHNLPVVEINKSSTTTGVQLWANDSGVYLSDSDMIKIEGTSMFSQNLTLMVINTETNETVSSINKTGPFRHSLPLTDGLNSFEYRIGNENHSIHCSSIKVDYTSPKPTDATPTAEIASAAALPSSENESSELVANKETFRDLPAKTASETASASGDSSENSIEGLGESTDTPAPVVYKQPSLVKSVSPKLVKDPDNRRRTLKGKVMVGFVIGVDGKVEPDSISILDSSHPLLSEEAKKTMLKWRFTPAEKNGVAVRKKSKVPLSWN